VQKGVRFKAPYVSEGTERLNYLEIPVGIKFKGTTPKSRPYLYLGGGLDFLVAQDVDERTYSRSFLSGSYESIDFTAHIGGGVEFVGKNGMNVFLEIRYTPGLFSIEEIPNGTMKTSSVLIQIGILFASTATQSQQ
jgi:hypothetical protein